MNDQKKGHGLWSGLVIGSLIGAGVAYYLTSTKEGREVKEKIKKKTDKAIGGLGEMVSDLEEKGEEFKKKAKVLQKKLEEKAEEMEGELGKEAKEQLSNLEEIREKGRRATKKFFTRNGKKVG